MPTELPPNRALWTLAPNAEVVFDRSCLLPVALWFINLGMIVLLACTAPVQLEVISQAFFFAH
jgi:hypothetical protein